MYKYGGSLTKSSKGNQIKFESNGKIIKLDLLGYEGLAEAIAYDMALCTNIENPLEYNTGKFKFDNRMYTGCSSKNFLDENEEFVSYWRLMKSYGFDYKKIAREKSTEGLIVEVIEFIDEVTGLDSKIWLAKLIEFDFLIKNDDRHLRNIGLIYDSQSKTFNYMPIFDNGGGMMSDLTMYQPYNSVRENENLLNSKPFNCDRHKQLEAIRNVCGSHLIVNTEEILDISVFQYSEYHVSILQRVEEIVRRSVMEWKLLERSKGITKGLTFK